jgi:5,10-methylenetetrahydrofolate reductase
MQADQDPAVLRWHAPDALILLVRFANHPYGLKHLGIYNQPIKKMQAIIKGVKKTGVKRLLFVRGDLFR